MTREFLEGRDPGLARVANAVDKVPFMNVKHLEVAKIAYTRIVELWEARYPYGATMLHITQYPRSDAGEWMPGRPYTFPESIALARREGLYKEHFLEQIKENAEDAKPRADALSMANVLWNKWGNAAEAKPEEERDVFDRVVGNLLREATNWMTEEALVEQGAQLQMLIHAKSRKRVGEYLWGFGKSKAFSMVITAAGLKNPLAWPLAIAKASVRPVDRIYKKVTGKYPIYGVYPPKQPTTRGWQNVSADSSQFESAYTAFVRLYNHPLFAQRVLDAFGKQIFLPEGKGKEVKSFMKILAEAIYIYQLPQAFCRDNEAAAIMEFCNSNLAREFFGSN